MNEECELGLEEPEDIQMQLQTVKDCLLCEKKDCPVKNLLVRWCKEGIY